MKDSIKQKTLLFLFLLLSTSILAQDSKRVSDTIRWEENYTVQWAQDVIIDSNQVLVIEPGVRFKMEGSYSIIVYGEVLALGKVDKPIRISSYYDQGWGWNDTATVEGGWGGFRFMDGAGKRSEFQHCIFSHGKNNIPASPFLISQTGDDANPKNVGGAIYARNYGTLVFENCQFKENMARSAGGAVFAKDVDTIQFHNCFFEDNQVLYEGGCIWSYNYDYLNVSNCVFVNNLAGYGDFDGTDGVLVKGALSTLGGRGAAINCISLKTTTRTVIKNSRFHNNFSLFNVVEAHSTHVVYANNLATNNFSSPLVTEALSSGCAHIYNNTFAYNLAYNMRAVIILSGRFIVQNNIAWQNRCTCIEFPRYQQIDIHNKLYQDWQFTNNVIWEGRYEKGIDIITDDPLFVNPAPLAGINVNGWEYDWRLRNDSPAINAGSSQTYYGYELPEFDFEGNPRVAGSVDIGCYENQTVIGINENKMSGLVTIYPNPFHNSFKIKLNKGEAVAQISIYNATGATVAKQQITSESNEVMLENVPSGLYFLSVETPNGNRTTTKIVKE